MGLLTSRFNLFTVDFYERDFMKDNRTIAAISTPQGTGGISVIRISGADAVSIASAVFTGRDLRKVQSHTIHYGFIKNSKGEKVD